MSDRPKKEARKQKRFVEEGLEFVNPDEEPPKREPSAAASAMKKRARQAIKKRGS